MDVKEFRVGNLVADVGCFSIPDEPEYTQLTAADFNNWEEFSIFMAPIPLTPEIFEKCGFKKQATSNEYWDKWILNNGWHISQWIHDSKMAGFEEKGVCYWGEDYVPVKYVHQLQNLYFCLTNMELAINQ